MAAVWDLSAKKRLRQLPKYPSSISCLSFNCDGTKLAVAGSSFLEEGTSKEGMINALWIRDGVLAECKVRGFSLVCGCRGRQADHKRSPNPKHKFV